MRAPSRAILNWRADAALLALAIAPGLAFADARLTPSGPAVAENLLRIELHLDAPLAAPLDMAHVALSDSAGTPIPDAFLDLPLPDRRGTSVTLLLHPGRIKSGVGPNLAVGPALQRGQYVTLRIDDPHIGSPLERRWFVTAPWRQRIDPGQWSVQAVRRGGRQPLRVVLPAALDAAATGHIAVQGPDGRRVAGEARLVDGERVWRFTPSSGWGAGKYLLRIHPSLEDPQGNRLCAAFEEAGQSALPCRDEGHVVLVVD